MAEQKKLVLGFIGNGKSANRCHLPFILTRQNKGTDAYTGSCRARFR